MQRNIQLLATAVFDAHNRCAKFQGKRAAGSLRLLFCVPYMQPFATPAGDVDVRHPELTFPVPRYRNLPAECVRLRESGRSPA